MKNKINILLLLMVCSFSLMMTTEAATMDYSVTTNLPKSQVDSKKTYFDLELAPKDTEELSLTINNTSDEKKIITIEPTNASTNQNGVIDYSPRETKRDKTLKTGITNLISKTQRVVLKPHEQRDISFHLKMPEKEFKGTILGSFYVSEEVSEITSKKSEQVQIQNKYAFVIGIKLRNTSVKIPEKIVLNEVKAQLVNYRTAITANLQNSESVIINNLNVQASVYKEKETEALYELDKSGLEMAPNSNFDLPITLDNEKFESGSYRIELVAKTSEETWKFSKKFKISHQESKELNKEAVDLPETSKKWIYIITISLLILVLGVILFILNKKYQFQKKET